MRNLRCFIDGLEISMQYLCATFGSDNRMYRNYCTFQEVVNSTFPDQNQVAIRAPCRSFCVQVATVCANDPTFIQTCDRINCPPIDDSCTSGEKKHTFSNRNRFNTGYVAHVTLYALSL